MFGDDEPLVVETAQRDVGHDVAGRRAGRERAGRSRIERPEDVDQPADLVLVDLERPGDLAVVVGRHVVEVTLDDAREQRLVEAEELHLEAQRLGEIACAHAGRVELLYGVEALIGGQARHVRQRRDLVERAAEEAVGVERADDGAAGAGGIVGDVEQGELVQQVVVERLDAADEVLGVGGLGIRVARSRRLHRVEILVHLEPLVPRALVFLALLRGILTLERLGLGLVDLEHGVLEHLDFDELLEVGDGHGQNVETLIDLRRQGDLVPELRAM